MLKIELNIIIESLDKLLYLMGRILKEENNPQIVAILTRSIVKLGEIKGMFNFLEREN